MKTILISLIFLLFYKNINAQEVPKIFLYDSTITKMSKDSILKADSLIISNNTYEIINFTYVFTALHVDPKWGIIKGNKFSEEFIKKFSENARYGTLIIADVVVHKRNTNEPNRKLVQNLVIDYYYKR